MQSLRKKITIVVEVLLVDNFHTNFWFFSYDGKLRIPTRYLYNLREPLGTCLTPIRISVSSAYKRELNETVITNIDQY